jgi:plastocyanin
VHAKSLILTTVVLATGAWTISTVLHAQARSNDANVTMMDDCSTADAGYNAFGGCPEGAPFPGSNSFKGDVSVAEFFALLFSPLTAPGHVIGHPSWRNEPSYISIPAGQNVRVTNRGGRAHSFTEVVNFGGGFVPPLNGTMTPAPECSNPAEVELLRYGQSQKLEGLEPGLHKFQCCIHPWMRGSVKVN